MKVELGRLPRIEGDSAIPLQPRIGAPPPRPAEVHNIELDAADKGMYGNDVWGNCVWVMIEKDRVISAEALGVPITKLTPAQVIQNYCDYAGIGNNPKVDAPGPGSNILGALKWAQNHPERMGGNKLLFYGDFPITDDAMKEAVAEFASVCVGVTVYASMEYPARFWYVGPRGKKLGGHGVAGGSYTPLDDFIKTWGYEVAVNGAGLGTIDELVVCVWDFQWAALTYARQTELIAAYTAVTGKSWTGPAPVMSEEVMLLVLDPTTAVGDFILNGNHQTLDLATGKVVNTTATVGTTWPCFGRVPSSIPGGVHFLVQPPEIGHLCAEGTLGGTFVPRSV